MRVILIFILFICFFDCEAQEISFAFNSTFSGRNCALTYIKSFEKSEIGLGLRYNINQWANPDDQSNIYYKRQYAYEPMQHVGVQVYYHHFIWSMIYGFYDVQFSHSETLTKIMSAHSFDPDIENPTRPDPENEVPTHDDLLYKRYIERFGPFTWVEQNIGIGFKFKISDSIYLTQKAGVGVMLLFGSDEQLPQTWPSAPEWTVSTLLNIGLTYKFN